MRKWNNFAAGKYFFLYIFKPLGEVQQFLKLETQHSIYIRGFLGVYTQRFPKS